MAASQLQLADTLLATLKPIFAGLGLSLESFIVENVSLPDELQKVLDQRIGMNMIGDMGRYTQYQVAQSIPIAAGNEGGGFAGAGVGLGAGMMMGQQMMNAQQPMNPQQPYAPPAPGAPGPVPPTGPQAPAAAGAGTKFCINCGHSIPRAARFCADCGSAQQ
jgi:membrane protease subunit (stomatin/prohibitin family)